MIQWQTTHDSVVMMDDNGVTLGLSTKTLYDSVVLTKDTGLKRGLSIDEAQ